MLNCIGGAKEIDVSKHLSSPAWVLMMGKYGARDEIQAPACASFLFRPSLPVALAAGRQILASHSNLQAPGALPGPTWSQNTVDNGGSKRPNCNWIDRAPFHTHNNRLHNHTRPTVCPYPVCSLTDRQLLTRRIQRRL